MSLLFSRRSLAGIDIGSSGIKIVKLKKRGVSSSLEGLGYVKLPFTGITEEGFRIRETLASLINIRKMKIKKVASTIWVPSLTFKYLYLPRMPKGDLREAVRWEMRKEVNFPPDELICDFVNIGEIKKGEETLYSIIAFGVRKGEVNQLIETLSYVSLEPLAVDVTPMAMLSAFDHNNVWEDGINYAMIDIGATKTTLAIFKDRRLKFIREVAFGGRELDRAIAEGLSKTAEEAEEDKIMWGIGDKLKAVLSVHIERLALEIHRSFDYYQAQFREGGINKVFLCGGTAMLKGLVGLLSDLLGTPCFVDDPFKNIKVDPRRFGLDEVKGIAPMLTLAVGLALRPD